MALAAPSIPGMGVIALAPHPPHPSHPPFPPVALDEFSLSNDLVSVTLLRSGRLDLHDLVRDHRFPGLLEILGVTDRGDTYTFCPDGRSASSARPARSTVASSPLAPVWRARGGLVGRTGTGPIDLRLTVQVFAGSPIVRCRLHLGNQAQDHRLRLGLPLGLDGEPLTTGAQFGTVLRDRPDLEVHRSRQASQPSRCTAAPRPRATIVAWPSWRPVSSRPSGSTATCM